jgi:thiol:disulfide interchange protein DsbD
VGAFFNGVLATALATPCTAPFLGAAMGFAFTQSALIILGFFVMTALGLALPYVLLTWNPGWLQFVPRPGLWMVRFKIAMGFPMLATAVWLLFLAIGHYGQRGLWLGLFLVVAATSAWIYGEFVQRGRSRRGLAGTAALLLLVGGYYYSLEQQLHWRLLPAPTSQDASNLQSHPEGIPWQRWNLNAVAQARAEGRVAFVDFTADWCLTCNANKKFSIEIPAVKEKLNAINAAAFLADYTRPAASPEITDELRKHGRAGVPLVLVYPRNAMLPPVVLPELLTPTIVLDALTQAAQ